MTTHADRPGSALAATFETFFETKTAADVEGTMSYFSTELASYIDATLGWDFDSYEALKAVFEQYMPNWSPPARSYTTAVLSNETSALVHMTDTPELFGGELRILAAVDFADGKIVRWVDYWDSSAFDDALYEQFRTPRDSFPRDFKDSRVKTQAASEVVKAATALQAAFAAGDAQGAADVMHTDVLLEDMSLRAQVIGRLETTSYLDRILGDVPYGRSSELRHVVGGSRGGGFEWTAGDEAGLLVGITALELDAHGLITRITSVYDSRQLEPARKEALIGATFAH
jgi:ketosteroid isomerase-like protein